MPAIMRECKMCHKLTPPLSLFKWDSKVEQHNKNFNGKNVCNLCYKILQEKSCRINDVGKTIVGFKFY